MAHEGLLNKEQARVDCIDCPLCEAPGCFQAALVSSLESGGDNYLPTNWKGFSEYYECGDSGRGSTHAATAEKVVQFWAYSHPDHLNHTIRSVLGYAKRSEHRLLMEAVDKALHEHIIDDHTCSGDSECFQACTRCKVQKAWSASLQHSPSPSSLSRHSFSAQSQPSSSISSFSSPSSTSAIIATQEQLPSLATDHDTPEVGNSNSVHAPASQSATEIIHSLQGLGANPQQAASVIHYNGPVTNKVYNLTMQNPLIETATKNGGGSSAHVQNTELKTASASCQEDLSSMPNSEGAGRYSSKHCAHAQEIRSNEFDEDGVGGRLSQNMKPEFVIVSSEVSSQQQVEHSLLGTDHTKDTRTTQTAQSGDPSTENGVANDSAPDNSEELAGKDTEVSCQKEDVLHDFGNRLFDAFPYSFFQKHYRHRTKEIVRTLFIFFFLYQGFSIIVMTMCEDGGLHHIFRSKGGDRSKEIASRFLKFLVKLSFRIVLPVCCVIQLPVIASKPRMPHTSFSVKEAGKRMLRIHDFFSSEEEVTEIRNNPDVLFSMSEEMVKRRIHSMWLTLLHAVLLVSLGYHIGAFHVCEAHTMKAGVCKFLNSTIIYLPMFNAHIHTLMIPEMLSIMVILLLIGVTKDCYTYENRVAVYATIIGGEAKSLYYEIRRRWSLMDMCMVFQTLLLIAITAVSLGTGRTFTPIPPHAIGASDLIDFYFWICILTILTFLATSSKRMLKHASLWSYMFAGFLIFVIKVESSHVPFGSIIVLLFSFESAVAFNFLICLFHCHYHHVRESSHYSVGSVSTLFWVGALCCSLLASLAFTFYLEVANSAMFFFK